MEPKPPPIPSRSTHDAADVGRFLNRELSWLEFNNRVLDQALTPSTPLLEKLKFLSIVGSNLDEFFMVRVAGLKKMIQEDIPSPDYPDRPDMRALNHEIRLKAAAMVDKQYSCLKDTVIPGLKQEGVRLLDWSELNETQRGALGRYFDEEVFPVLTPLAFDPAHPFPFLSNLSLYLVAVFKRHGGPAKAKSLPLGFVEIPSILPRLIPVPDKDSKFAFVLLGDLIAANLKTLFLGFEIEQTTVVRVTRNLDYTLLENEVVDLLKTIQSELVNRSHQEAVRLEAAKGTPEPLLQLLKSSLWLEDDDVYLVDHPLNVRGLMALYDLPLEQLKEPTFNPRIPNRMESNADIFALISAGDFLVHHPYESFYAVTEFLNSAASDPAVYAIKQTLYRTSGDSPIIDALIAAAEQGKQVTAVLELKARFDEKNNIVWARRMERAGVNVVFGFVGLKTHAKVTMIVRHERDKLVRYVHLSTGNYNTNTAKFYTDIGVFTKNPEIGAEVSALFNLLTGFNVLTGDIKRREKVQLPTFKHLAIAPIDMRTKIAGFIEREIELHKKSGGGHIIAKMNSLVDKKIIELLYAASQVGVKVQLIIRGMCCLRPGVSGMSENIEVISIVDRFLEHSRVFYFNAGGAKQVFLSSADWMPRNLDRRIEILFPVLDEDLRKRVINQILAISLADNTNTYVLQSDGSYVRKRSTSKEPAFRSQQRFIEEVREGGIKSIPYDKAVRHDPTRSRGKRPVARKSTSATSSSKKDTP